MARKCVACGRDETARDRLVVIDSGSRVHMSHVADPRSGLYGSQRGSGPAAKAAALMCLAVVVVVVAVVLA